MAKRDKITRSAFRRSGGGDGIQQLTATDGTVVLTPSSGLGPVVDLSAPGAGTIGTIVAGDTGLTITNPNGPVTTIGQNVAGEWTLGVTRIYAVDAARPNDLGAGFTDPASSSAADYRTASVAAGAVAKKTVAGLAAIFPKVGNGRQVEIQIAAGAYNGDDLSTLLNGCAGYASIVVRGTGTVATAGTTKFDGTAVDTSVVGGVTGTGLNAAGYNPTGLFIGTDVFRLTKVGGANPGFAAPSGLPAGIRCRWDVATGSAALQNTSRQVRLVIGTDQVAVQSLYAANLQATDLCYMEQPGVRLTGSLNLVAAGTDGLVLVGLAFAGALNVDPAAGRHRFVFCTFDDAGTETLQSATGVVVAQSYTHTVYGSVTPGGGLLVQGSITVTGQRLSLEGLVAKVVTSIVASDGTMVWGAGCLTRNLVVKATTGSDSEDTFGSPVTDAPNLGVSNTTVGQPVTFGSDALSFAAVFIDASTLRLGCFKCQTFNTAAGVMLGGKCNVGFVGNTNVQSDGSGASGLDLTMATDSEVRIGSGIGALPALTGVNGDIAWSAGSGPAYGTWAAAVDEDRFDTGGNHIYYGTLYGLAHRTPQSVFQGLFFHTSGDVLVGGLLRKTADSTSRVEVASNTNVTDVTGLAGVSQMAASSDAVKILVRAPGGCSTVAFIADPTNGRTVYLSATAGLATDQIPTSGPVIPIGVVVQQGIVGAKTGVIQWLPAGTNTAQADWPLPVSNAVPNIRWYALDFVNGIDTNIGFSDTSAADAGTKAVKTAARLNQILPIDGKGRNVVVLIAASDYADSSSFLMGRSGYKNFITRATVTDATAGSTAFLDDTNDRNMNGNITATGMNAAGYNPTGAPTTRAIQCLKVGGAAPAFPAEVPISLPGGSRIRFDINTTTVALRGIRRTVVKVAGTDTLTVDKLLPAAPVAADIFYLEMPGVKFTELCCSLFNGPDNGGVSFLAGLQSTGTVAGARAIFSQGNVQFADCYFSGTQASILRGGTVSLNSIYVNINNTNQDTGGACRSAGRFSITGSAQYINPSGTGPYCGSFGLDRAGTGEPETNFVAVTGVSYTRCKGTAQNSAETDPDCIGTVASQVAAGYGPCRILGPGSFTPSCGLVLGSDATISSLDITGMGAVPAIVMTAAGLAVVITGPLTGATGNTDVGLDLTNAQDCTIYLDAVPTVTGTAGDIRLAGGQIVTWAAAANGITDSRGNRIFGTAGLPLVPLKFTASLFGGAGAALSYAADTSPVLLVANEAVAVRYPTSQCLKMRLRVTVLALSTNTINNTVTLFKNGVATAMTITIPAATAAFTKFVDSAHPIVFADGDDFALQIANAGADVGAVTEIAAVVEQAS